MQFLQSKINTVKRYLDDRGLYDPRLLGLVAIAVIAVSVLWNGAKVVQQNYELQRKVTELEQENQVLALQNANKKLQNQYYESPTFAELTARRVYGKASPGERVYVVEEGAGEELLTTPLPTEDTPEKDDQVVVERPKYQQNFEAWMQFFFGD